uniref:DNA-methyltransferase n=1 Tax=Bacteroides xylanisolvens TaxID=371601 RepID=UPI004025BA97
MTVNQIYISECLSGLRKLPDNSINCCITSPPYYGLRDYQHKLQIGLEKTPEEYIDKLVSVFHEVYRVLKDDGTLWVNIGDSYAGSMKGAARFPDNAMNYKQGTNRGTLGKATLVKQCTGCKNKDLIGIPWMLAFALRADGWYLRQDIIWSKPNPMPESVTDRCTKSHEYIFLLSKSKKYYFDSESIQQTASQSVKKRIGKVENVGHKAFAVADSLEESNPMFRKNTTREYEYADKANKRSVWHVPTSACKEAHFAVFPEKLIVDCIKAGCPDRGIVLDPFMGYGTTAVVARKLDRNYIGFELNPDYVCLAEKRISEELGIFK